MTIVEAVNDIAGNLIDVAFTSASCTDNPECNCVEKKSIMSHGFLLTILANAIIPIRDGPENGAPINQ